MVPHHPIAEDHLHRYQVTLKEEEVVMEGHDEIVTDLHQSLPQMNEELSRKWGKN